jgi:predicted transcriptional regulator
MENHQSKEERIQTEEQPKLSQKDFEKVKELLNNQDEDYTDVYLLRKIRENDNLRRVFLSVMKNSPARIYEIVESSLLSKNTCYTQLYKLMEMKLVAKIAVMSVMNGNIKNERVSNKFKEWTANMPENLKNYYLAKTSFWEITDFGKRFSLRSYEMEQEFRKKEKK